MAASSGGPLLHHLGAFRQQEADVLSASAACATSSFRLEVDDDAQQGLLWLVQQQAEAKQPPTPPSSSSDHQQQQHYHPPSSSPCSVHDPELLCELMDLKAAFEQTPRGRFSAARARANPYEALVEGSPFLNRSALKMANLNHLVGGALLSSGVAGGGGVLTFADLCGGPGGFSQFVLAMQEARGRPARGWGITLEGDECPWDVEKLGRWIVDAEARDGQRERAAVAEERGRWGKRPRSPSVDDDGGAALDRSQSIGGAAAALVHQKQQQQQVLRLCFGADGTGDLCRPENVRHFARQVRAEIGDGRDGDGVDVVMADGGFAAARSRFDQEARMLPLIVAEVGCP